MFYFDISVYVILLTLPVYVLSVTLKSQDSSGAGGFDFKDYVPTNTFPPIVRGRILGPTPAGVRAFEDDFGPPVPPAVPLPAPAAEEYVHTVRLITAPEIRTEIPTGACPAVSCSFNVGLCLW